MAGKTDESVEQSISVIFSSISLCYIDWVVCICSHIDWLVRICSHIDWLVHICSHIDWLVCICSHLSSI